MTRSILLSGLLAVAAAACTGSSPLESGGHAGASAGAGGAGVGGADAGAAGGASGVGSIDAAGGNPAARPDGGCVANAYPRNGACACQEGSPDVCDGACTDLAHDPQNCGVCGKTCAATATCNAGRCGPEVVSIVPAAPGCGSLQLALADSTVYWTDRGHGTVKRLRLGVAGSTPTTLSASEKGPGLIEVNGSTLVWIDVVSSVTQDVSYVTTTTARVRRASVTGGAPLDLAIETNSSGGIRGVAFSTDAQAVFYAAETKIKAVPVAGGAPVEVGREARGGIPTALGVDGDLIGFIVDLNTNVDGILVKAGASAICGGDPIDPVTGRPSMVDCVRVIGCNPDATMERFIVRGGKGYWGNGPSLTMGVLDGDAFTGKQLIAPTVYEGSITGIAAGTHAFYFGEDGGDGVTTGFIEVSPDAPDSTATAIARGQLGPHALVFDGSRLYWATKDCAINAVDVAGR